MIAWRDWRGWLPLACPVAYGLTALIVAIGLHNGSHTHAEQQALLERVGMDVAQISLRRVLSMPIATLVQTDPGMPLTMVLMVFIPLILLEHVIGSWRTLLTFFACDWLSIFPNLGALWLLARLGNAQAQAVLDTADAGSSAAAHGTLAAFFWLLPGWWRWAGLGGLFTYIVIAFWFQRVDDALIHLISCFVGIGFGMLWQRYPAGRLRAARTAGVARTTEPAGIGQT